MVREPSSQVAADAYDGLRKQVVSAVSARQSHLAQLVQLDAALSGNADRETLVTFAAAWFEQASLLRVLDADHPDLDVLFETVEDLGGPVQILAPAYVDAVTGRLIRTGRLRRGPVPQRTVAGEPPGGGAAPAPYPAELRPEADGAAATGRHGAEQGR